MCMPETGGMESAKQLPKTLLDSPLSYACRNRDTLGATAWKRKSEKGG